jgi:hypothetical protein
MVGVGLAPTPRCFGIRVRVRVRVLRVLQGFGLRDSGFGYGRVKTGHKG